MELTPREVSIICLVSQGYTNAEVAEQIGTTPMVVKNYLQVIYDKTGMSSRLELALWHVHHVTQGLNETRCERCRDFSTCQGSRLIIG